MLNIKIIILYFLFFTAIFSKEFNLSINPKKIELNPNINSVNEIHLINHSNEVLNLLMYFETPIEFENNNIENTLKIYPKFIKINSKDEKIIKLVFKKDEIKNLKKGELYKTYLIFKEIPNNSEKIHNNELLILNEIGIAIIMENPL